MTDKQNYFTYTDNTSDNNDKIMENLHKQMDIGQCPYEGECQLCKSACSVDVYCFIKQLFNERNIAEEQLYIKNQECENWESLCKHADKQIDELEAENDKYIKVLVEIQDEARDGYCSGTQTGCEKSLQQILQKCEVILDEKM